MKLRIVEDYQALSRVGATMLAELIAQKPDATVVVATGDTPMGVYQELARLRTDTGLDTTQLRVFQLDAYLGLAPDDRRSLYGWMLRSFIEPLGIPLTQVVRLPGDTADPAAACQAYIQAVQLAGGFDLSILGLGPNGHLGFNEPPSAAHDPTRVIDLTAESVVSNARYWGSEGQVPRQALTCGMDLLLAARQTLLVVAGAHKRAILHQTIAGPLTPALPASYLHQAANVTVLVDQAAWGDASQPDGTQQQ